MDKYQTMSQWRCPRCRLWNDSDQIQCIACFNLNTHEYWECSACHLLNTNSSIRCIACFNLNTFKYWKCSQCDLLNKMSRPKCTACFNINPCIQIDYSADTPSKRDIEIKHIKKSIEIAVNELMDQKTNHNDEHQTKILHLASGVSENKQNEQNEQTEQIKVAQEIYKLAKEKFELDNRPLIIDSIQTINKIVTEQVDQKNDDNKLNDETENYKHEELPLTLAMNIHFNKFNKHAFKQEFANKMKVPYSRINIISVYAGSTVVDLMVVAITTAHRYGTSIENIAQQIFTDEGQKALGELKIFAMEVSEVERRLPQYKKTSRNVGVPFYLTQSRHTLSTGYPVTVGYSIEPNVQRTWKSAMKRAVRIVNKTCPGINIVVITQQPISIQIIVKSIDEKSAYTRGNILRHHQVEISLGTPWSLEGRKSTALHELLHALGIQHEFKRKDRVKCGIKLNQQKCQLKDEWSKWASQYEIDGMGITPYDPHSIMHYEICDGEFDIDADKITVIARSSPLTGTARRNVLSPLDEIGLNLLYPPYRRSWYNPSVKATGLMYCGRPYATKGHNYPGEDATDGQCGPTNGANCTACRVLTNGSIPKYNNNNEIVWQGSSGMFYCGEYFGVQSNGHDGYCGPTNGPQCRSCEQLID